MDEVQKKIRAHWSGRGDLEQIRTALQRRGVALDDLAPDDLSVLDQLHAGQLEATRALVEWAQIDAGLRVLDVGAGLGGPARYLAWERGCEVTALELVEELVTTGREITQWLGLEELVDHRCGGIEAFDAGPFQYDLILLQHVDMHLPDKVRAYKVCRAALKPSTSSRVLWHDWLAGPGGPLRLPVPWAEAGEAITFLSSYDELRTNLVSAGLALHRFQPLLAETAMWFTRSRDQIQRVLTKQGADTQGRAGLEQLLAEVEGALTNLAEQRIVPFFAEARFIE